MTGGTGTIEKSVVYYHLKWPNNNLSNVIFGLHLQILVINH